MNILSFWITKVFADEPSNQIIGTGPGGLAQAPQGVQSLISDTSDILFAILGGITLIVIIVVSFKMFSSKGNEAEFKKGINGVVNAAVGLLIIGLAYAIVKTILSLQFK